MNKKHYKLVNVWPYSELLVYGSHEELCGQEVIVYTLFNYTTA